MRETEREVCVCACMNVCARVCECVYVCGGRGVSMCGRGRGMPGGEIGRPGGAPSWTGLAYPAKSPASCAGRGEPMQGFKQESDGLRPTQ